MLVTVLWCCTWGRDWEGAMAPAPLSTGFQSLPPLPIIKLGPSGAGSRVGGLVHTLGPMGLSNDLSCEAGSFSCCLPNPHGCFQSEVWGFISRSWSPGLCGLLCSPPFVPVYLCENVGLRGATRHSACPVLRHSESGPLGLSVRECGAAGAASAQTACPIRPTLRQSQSRHSHPSPLRPGCPSPPLLPVWMNVYFLSPWCRTFMSFDFLSVLVVWGGAVCLPTLPSWFSRNNLNW